MAIEDPPSGPARSDGTVAIVGDQGVEIAQDASTGELLSAIQGDQDVKIAQNADGELIAEIQGDQGAAVAQDADSNKLVFRRAESEQADIPIPPTHNLNNGDFVIPDDTSLSSPPEIGGASDVILFVESIDSSENQTSDEFTVTVEYVNADGSTTYFVLDETDISKLQTDKLMLDIRPARDYVKITISSTLSNTDHYIRGGMNAQ